MKISNSAIDIAALVSVYVALRIAIGAFKIKYCLGFKTNVEEMAAMALSLSTEQHKALASHNGKADLRLLCEEAESIPQMMNWICLGATLCLVVYHCKMASALKPRSRRHDRGAPVATEQQATRVQKYLAALEVEKQRKMEEMRRKENDKTPVAADAKTPTCLAASAAVPAAADVTASPEVKISAVALPLPRAVEEEIIAPAQEAKSTSEASKADNTRDDLSDLIAEPASDKVTANDLVNKNLQRRKLKHGSMKTILIHYSLDEREQKLAVTKYIYDPDRIKYNSSRYWEILRAYKGDKLAAFGLSNVERQQLRNEVEEFLRQFYQQQKQLQQQKQTAVVVQVNAPKVEELVPMDVDTDEPEQKETSVPEQQQPTVTAAATTTTAAAAVDTSVSVVVRQNYVQPPVRPVTFKRSGIKRKCPFRNETDQHLKRTKIVRKKRVSVRKNNKKEKKSKAPKMSNAIILRETVPTIITVFNKKMRIVSAILFNDVHSLLTMDSYSKILVFWTNKTGRCLKMLKEFSILCAAYKRAKMMGTRLLEAPQPEANTVEEVTTTTTTTVTTSVPMADVDNVVVIRRSNYIHTVAPIVTFSFSGNKRRSAAQQQSTWTEERPKKKRRRIMPSEEEEPVVVMTEEEEDSTDSIIHGDDDDDDTTTIMATSTGGPDNAILQQQTEPEADGLQDGIEETGSDAEAQAVEVTTTPLRRSKRLQAKERKKKEAEAATTTTLTLRRSKRLQAKESKEKKVVAGKKKRAEASNNHHVNLRRSARVAKLAKVNYKI